MYLQITTKCNMSCDHCCYSCSMRGKHGEYSTIIDSIAFARDTYGDECISIGGGEPTLHPRFFDILKHCIEDFDYVWMATNGSQTETMHRLNDIINQEDWPECDCEETLEPDEFEEYGCLCHEKMDDNTIHQEDKLSVALSLDYWHDPIDERIEDMWRQQAKKRESHFEIRDVSQRDGPIAAGRGKRTGAGYAEGCPCSDILIKPDGKLRLCGCTRSPVIGDVWSGIEDKWDDIINSDSFRDTNCYKSI